MDANNFRYSSAYCYAEFEQLLTKITLCYKCMIASGERFENDENKIRDCLLLNYLKNDEVRRGVDIGNYNFEREVPEDIGNGRVDIKITSPDVFTKQAAYFTLECKRINAVNVEGDSGLNCKYVTDGMLRYIDGKYTSYYKTNGMIGFVVDTMDINSNISHINSHISTHIGGYATNNILPEAFIPDFDYHYSSVHTKSTGETIKLYHLMFDVSSCIATIS